MSGAGGEARSVAPAVVLGAGDVEAIAGRVAELLDGPTPKLLKADEVARLLGVDVGFVYAHQDRLGVKGGACGYRSGSVGRGVAQ